MEDRDRNLIKKVANKTGATVSYTKQSLEDFKEVGIYPTAKQLTEYMRLRLSPVTLYTRNDNDDRVSFTKVDYIKKALR
ncbi:MAG: hypothetical protein IJF92_00870 [Bacilli bacterium]|nr:hypothetical protein [Bacilli bacterium]MBQ3307634.1 hypothetical protein [Bacilli bacterium]